MTSIEPNTPKSLRGTLQALLTEISEDLAADVDRHDGSAVTGQLLGEMHGELAGSMSTLAQILKVVIDHSALYDVVQSSEELDALPTGVIVRSAAGTVASRFDKDHGVVFGDERPFSPWTRLELPAMIIWRPVDE